VREFQRAASLQIETARDACLFPFAKRLREQPPDRYRQCRLVFLLSGPRLDSLPFLDGMPSAISESLPFPRGPRFLGITDEVFLQPASRIAWAATATRRKPPPLSAADE
jgi:hypothetical protein